MTIGQIIRKMRREMDITQEELAELLHITSQAVSRWENGVTVPDIGSVIALTRIFNCSADDLLGLGDVKKADRLQYYEEIAEKASYEGRGEDVIAAYRNALAEYPGDFELMLKLAFRLSYYSPLYDAPDNPLYRDRLTEAQALYENILNRCTDVRLLNKARADLCGVLVSLGKREKMLEHLNHFPDIRSSRQVMRFNYEPEQPETVSELFFHSLELLKTSLEAVLYRTTKEKERLQAAKQLEGIHILFDTQELPTFFTTLAYAYALSHDAENTLRLLKQAAQTAVDVDTGRSTIKVHKTSHEDYCRKIREQMEIEEYDFVRDTPEFAEILRLFDTAHA